MVNCDYFALPNKTFGMKSQDENIGWCFGVGVELEAGTGPELSSFQCVPSWDLPCGHFQRPLGMGWHWKVACDYMLSPLASPEIVGKVC